jgi:hypothetical protein
MRAAGAVVSETAELFAMLMSLLAELDLLDSVLLRLDMPIKTLLGVMLEVLLKGIIELVGLFALLLGLVLFGLPLPPPQLVK